MNIWSQYAYSIPIDCATDMMAAKIKLTGQYIFIIKSYNKVRVQLYTILTE